MSTLLEIELSSSGAQRGTPRPHGRYRNYDYLIEFSYAIFV